MEKSEANKNFYSNICEPLFKEDNLLFKAIELFYDSKNIIILKEISKLILIILNLYYLVIVIV